MRVPVPFRPEYGYASGENPDLPSGSDGDRDRITLRTRCEALGFAVPQTTLETIMDLPRAWVRAKRSASWRAPDAEEHTRYDITLEPFADVFVAIATLDGETWLLGEQMFAGFPDPPSYVIFYLDRSGTVIATAERNALPRSWAQLGLHAG